VAVLGIGALVLGFIGIEQRGDTVGEPGSIPDNLYVAIQLFALESPMAPIPWPLQVARFLAPGVAAYAAVIALAALFREQWSRARVRWLRRGHVVVCGLGRIGVLVAMRLDELGRKVVVIEGDHENPAIAECRGRGIVVLVGDATDRVLLRTAIGRADLMFAVAGDDRANATLAITARELIGSRKGRPLTCYVHLLDVEMTGLLTQSEIAFRRGGQFRLEYFNVADLAAPTLLDRYPPFDLDDAAADHPPHILVVGLGQMGSRLVLHAARRWRGRFGPQANPIRVTVVDRTATAHVAALVDRHPSIVKTCELVAHDMDVGDPQFENAAFLGGAGPAVSLAYVCLGEDAAALVAVLRLQRRLRESSVPIVLRTTEVGGLAALLGRAAGDALQDVEVFEPLDLVCRPEVLLKGKNEVLARAIHEQYVLDQAREGRVAEISRALVPWEDLPEDLKESNRRQADDIGRKLRAIGSTIEPASTWDGGLLSMTAQEVEVMAVMEHDRWCEERSAEGWRYGPEKDQEDKTHPSLVPWGDLPEDVKEIDRGTVRRLPEFLAGVGFSVIRLRTTTSRSG
jgi:TrkA-N domain/RyR domain